MVDNFTRNFNILHLSFFHYLMNMHVFYYQLKIWFEDDVGLIQVGGERVVGGDLLPFLHLHHRQEDRRPLHRDHRQQDPRPLHRYHRQQDPRPLHRDHWQQDLLFSMFMRNHRFTKHSDGLHARSTWTTTARANFKHLMYNVRRNAERVCASTDKNQWKEHRPVWMRKEYWIELCEIWEGEKWNENSTKAKQNRAAHPEANVHTSGSVSFATHKARLEVQLKWPPQFQELFDETHKKKGTNDYISEKAREVAASESYSRGMDERYGDDSQSPELDPDIWVVASGAPKKGHFYGFGHSLGTARVISTCSSSVSHATSPFTTPASPGGSSSATPTMTLDLFREIVNESVSQNISTIISQTVCQTLAQLGILRDRALLHSNLR
ncbi:hypothetical protein Taro_043385 [Colocasia esculenta]|uniref:Uncharacterized protein n=1 Tax=Colocasia esculenta TaxID=4460 RepID=A0A843WYT5_COLES|nr:hypothetical protein [Colocasia esculenta]